MTKPQTLAEQIRALNYPFKLTDSNVLAIWNKAATVTAALEPDPTPALGWKAMQTAAKASIIAHSETARRRMRAAHEAKDVNDYDGWGAIVAHLDIAHDAIRALPGPTDAQLLAEAVKLPEVQALGEYARDASSALAYIQLLHGRLSGVGWERLAGLQLACSPIEAALALKGGA